VALLFTSECLGGGEAGIVSPTRMFETASVIDGGSADLPSGCRSL